MRKLSGIQILVSSVSAIFMILTGILFFVRRDLPYTAEGRYFDPATQVVYHEQSLDMLFILFIVLILFVLASVVWCVQTMKR